MSKETHISLADDLLWTLLSKNSLLRPIILRSEADKLYESLDRVRRYLSKINQSDRFLVEQFFDWVYRTTARDYFIVEAPPKYVCDDIDLDTSLRYCLYGYDKLIFKTLAELMKKRYISDNEDECYLIRALSRNERDMFHAWKEKFKGTHLDETLNAFKREWLLVDSGDCALTLKAPSDYVIFPVVFKNKAFCKTIERTVHEGVTSLLHEIAATAVKTNAPNVVYFDTTPPSSAYRYFCFTLFDHLWMGCLVQDAYIGTQWHDDFVYDVRIVKFNINPKRKKCVCVTIDVLDELVVYVDNVEREHKPSRKYTVNLPVNTRFILPPKRS